MNKYTAPNQKISVHRKPYGYKTISELFAESSEKYSDRTAYEIPRNNRIIKYNYSEVFEMATIIARYLSENGIFQGDKVAILSENRPEWGISFFSVPWIGAVAIPLDARAPLDDHASILRFSKSSAIILSNQYLKNVESIRETLPALKLIINMDNFTEIIEKYSSGISSVNTDPDDLMEILFTSGTTGDTKGVMLSHKNIISNVEDIYRVIDFNEEDKAFSILPVHHVYECTGGLLSPYYCGADVFYSRSLKPREMLEDLKNANPTIWLNSPLVLEKLYQRIMKEMNSETGVKSIITKSLPKNFIGKKVREKLGLKRIKYILSGGAALPEWVGKGLEEFGFPIIQGYGLSESSPLISVNPPDNPKNKSVGMIIPSVEAQIVDINSEGNGEIIAKGNNIMKGYYNNRTATDEVLTRDGWLKTGDLGYFDEDGYLYITGRKKFIIVTRGGKNISPEEVEEKICKSPLIEEAMVFSPDDSQIQALIYPNTDEVKEILSKSGLEYNDDNCRKLIQQEIRESNRNLEAYKKVSKFELRFEEFPKTTTRKIKRHLFRNYRIQQ